MYDQGSVLGAAYFGTKKVEALDRASADLLLVSQLGEERPSQEQFLITRC